jgi:hypothetical protein
VRVCVCVCVCVCVRERERERGGHARSFVHACIVFSNSVSSEILGSNLEPGTCFLA